MLLMRIRPTISVTLMLVLTVFAAPMIALADEKPPEIIPLEELAQENAKATTLRKAIDAEVDAYRSRIAEMND
jgi:hypothetical protein